MNVQLVQYAKMVETVQMPKEAFFVVAILGLRELFAKQVIFKHILCNKTVTTALSDQHHYSKCLSLRNTLFFVLKWETDTCNDTNLDNLKRK